MAEHDNRCRLVLIAPDGETPDAVADALSQALRGGDVATVILPQYGRSDSDFQAIAEAVVPVVQAAGVAAVIAGDSRVAGRAKADGLHIDTGVSDTRDALEKFAPKLIVGAGGIKERHTALDLGELRPDYVFFGKLDGDIKPEAHHKNLALAEWWASMIEIPCVVMGGTALPSALAVAETRAEFVALRRAVFEHPEGPAQAVAQINAVLAEKAPRFDDL